MLTGLKEKSVAVQDVISRLSEITTQLQNGDGGAGLSLAACHLYLGVASLQQADGELDALLEDLVVLGAHHQISEQLRPSFSVQAALNCRHRRPVPLLLRACTHTHTVS